MIVRGYAGKIEVLHDLKGSFLIELIEFCKKSLNRDQMENVMINKNGSVGNCNFIVEIERLNIRAGDIIGLFVNCESKEKGELIGNKIAEYLQGKIKLEESSKSELSNDELLTNNRGHYFKLRDVLMDGVSKENIDDITIRLMKYSEFQKQKDKLMEESFSTLLNDLETLISIITLLSKKYPSVVADPEIYNLLTKARCVQFSSEKGMINTNGTQKQ